MPKNERSVRLFKTRKAVFQAILLIVGAAMVGVGALRGEVDIVLSKAIRLCLECVGTVSYTHLTLPTTSRV